MRIELHYNGTKTYGTGGGTRWYSAKLDGDHEVVKLRIRFTKPPTGMVDSGASVEGFALSLSHSEAVEIATALLAFANHPTAKQVEARWMRPLEELPKLRSSVWKKALKLV